MPSVLITGGAGFIGSNAANVLAAAGYEVTAFDNLVLGNPGYLAPEVRFVRGDVENPAALEAVGGVDFIIHLAGASSAPMFYSDLAASVRNNVMGHTNILEYARKWSVRKLLFASTSSVYGNNPIPLSEDQPITPPNFYSVTKHCQEELSHVFNAVYGLEIIGFRFMSVYGLHEEHKGIYANLVSQFIWDIEKGRSPTVYGDGQQTRDFTNVRDLVQAFLSAIETPKRFGFTVLNVGTAEAISVLDMVGLINRLMGTSVPPKLIENPIHAGYVRQQQADLTRIREALQYEPRVSLEEGVREILDCRKTNPIAPVNFR